MHWVSAKRCISLDASYWMCQQIWFKWAHEIETFRGRLALGKAWSSGLSRWPMTQLLFGFLSWDDHQQLPRPFAFFFFLIFIYLWLCWGLASVRGPSPAVASRGHSSSRCAGLSPLQPLLLQNTGSRRAGLAIVAHGPSRSAARGILPDQGSKPCPPHCQADSQPLRHQGSPPFAFLFASGTSMSQDFQ